MNIKPNAWIPFKMTSPDAGDSIIIATIRGFNIDEALFIPKWNGMPFDKRFTHWCLGSCLPEVFPKRDYCRESWETLSPWTSADDYFPQLRTIHINAGQCAVSLELYRALWNMAISSAKEHGLENV